MLLCERWLVRLIVSDDTRTTEDSQFSLKLQELVRSEPSQFCFLFFQSAVVHVFLETQVCNNSC